MLAERPLGRYPVIGSTLEDFRGIVYVPGLFAHLDALTAGEATLESVAAEPMRLDADLPIAAAIDRFQEESQEMALVFEGERVAGLVTATDAFEAIAGQLEDPLDREEDSR